MTTPTRWDRLREWFFVRLIQWMPRKLAYEIASMFWMFAFSHVTDEQADHFLEVLSAGYEHWNEYAEDGDA